MFVAEAIHISEQFFICKTMDQEQRPEVNARRCGGFPWSQMSTTNTWQVVTKVTYDHFFTRVLSAVDTFETKKLVMILSANSSTVFAQFTVFMTK